MFAGLIDELFNLVEDRKCTTAPEAPAGAPLGRWAFSSSRQCVPHEVDNFNERFLKRELRRHFLSREADRTHPERHRGISKQAADMILRFRRNRWYEPVFHAPPQHFLFRGLHLEKKEELAKILREQADKIPDQGSKEGTFTAPPPTEKGYSTSWAPLKYVAFDFAREYGASRSGWAVVLTAEVVPNRLRFQAGPGGLYDVDGISYFHKERETLGIEPISVFRVEWKPLGRKQP
jgi:hypothetical protein